VFSRFFLLHQNLCQIIKKNVNQFHEIKYGILRQYEKLFINYLIYDYRHLQSHSKAIYVTLKMPKLLVFLSLYSWSLKIVPNFAARRFLLGIHAIKSIKQS